MWGDGTEEFISMHQSQGLQWPHLLQHLPLDLPTLSPFKVWEIQVQGEPRKHSCFLLQLRTGSQRAFSSSFLNDLG